LEYAGHTAYLLAANDALRTEFNKLSSAQQVKEIRKIGTEIEAVESGRKPFADRVKSTFAENEMKEILQAIDTNKIGERVSDDLVRELNELPNGPETFRHLMLNPDVAQRIAGMPSRRAAVLELGRLSAKLDRRPMSRAPTPIRPVSGGSSKSSVPLDQQDMSAYKKRRASGEK
jgi:hypothetical protein